MPAEIVKQSMRPARREEYIVLMDDYGAEYHLTLTSAFTPEQRSAKLNAAISSHSAGEAKFEAYVSAIGAPQAEGLSRLKTAGMTKKAAAKKANGITA